MPESHARFPKALEADLLRLYRDYFDMAKRRRRWSLRDDVPWADCNPSLDPAVADVVESFLAVELYLPDYVVRAGRRGAGRASLTGAAGRGRGALPAAFTA
jgi:acyl-[acyl-carrier-protein] desaturase